MTQEQHVNKYELMYRDIVASILSQGMQSESRTGKVQRLFGLSFGIPLKDGFPMLTGRQMFWNTIKSEAEWMLSGSTNVKDLHTNGVHIWDKWADENGDLGPVYGKYIHAQWGKIRNQIMDDPYSRRHIIQLWDYTQVDKMALPPCYHTLQFFTHDNGELHLCVNFRSSDVAVGLPYDVAVLSYLLYKMCGEICMVPGTLMCMIADAHINIENVPPLMEYMSRSIFPPPRLVSGELLMYTHGPHIKMTVKP